MADEDPLPVYRWGGAPPGLKTKTQLAALGLRVAGPARGRIVWRRGEALLYAEGDAVAKHAPTPGQLLALAKGRAAANTCPECGKVRNHKPHETRFGFHCSDCFAAAEDRWYEEHRATAVAWARKVLERPAVILDTETSHLHGYAVQVAVISLEGQTLFDELVAPQVPICPRAAAVHGITEERLRGCPSFVELLPRLEMVLHGREVIAYGVDYDKGVVWRELLRSQAATAEAWMRNFAPRWRCAMQAYARYVGEWNPHFGNFRYQSLPDGDHTAAGDCRATLKLIQQIAGLHSRADQL